MSVTFDMTLFREGVRQKLRVTKQTEAEVLNRAGGSICANAIRLTKGARKSGIVAALSKDGLAFKILQSPAMQSRLPRSLQGFHQGHHSRAELNAAVTRFLALRAASVRYIAAGWFKALRVFRPNTQRTVSDKGHAGQGRATKATERDLVATFENYSTGAAEVGIGPLQQAFDEEGASMKAYAERKLAEAWK